jgi:hypothetical protein
MRLRVYPNVVSLDEERRQRQAANVTDEAYRFHTLGGMVFGGIRAQEPETAPPPPPSHPAAQALLAGLMQGWGERENDPALLDAGKRLAETAQKEFEKVSNSDTDLQSSRPWWRLLWGRWRN